MEGTTGETGATQRVHPVLGFALGLEQALDKAAGIEPCFAATGEKRAALLALHRAEQRLHAVRLRLLAGSGDVAELDGARNVAAWLEAHTPTEHGPNHRDLQLAEALERRWPATGRALLAGELTVPQAQVLTGGLDELASDKTPYRINEPGGAVRDVVGVPPETIAAAEAHLLEAAAGPRGCTPRQLRRLAARILQVVAPGLDEDREARRLAEQERRAWERTSLFTRNIGDGRTRFDITVPDTVAHRLLVHLESFTAPRHRPELDPTAPVGMRGNEEKVPSYRRKGRAFCALLETLDPQRLPLHGGDATTLVVTITLDQLRREIGIAGLGYDGAGTISAAEARRLACTARIIPAVLGNESVPLDLGRTSRLFTPAQRKAMALRDHHCRAEGCSVPATWCEAHHHKLPWSKGGRTDVADGKLLCSFHHHRAHDDRYLHRELPDGDLRFHRRT
ncbi:MAG: DUF222 domain-containing protein [Marmoricola sp.]